MMNPFTSHRLVHDGSRWRVEKRPPPPPKGFDAERAALTTKLMRARIVRPSGWRPKIEVDQAAVYVGVKIRPARPPSAIQRLWSQMLAAGRRGAGKMARDAAAADGKHFQSEAKASAYVRERVGEQLWRRAKIKAGRGDRKRR
ncbi:MAG: hypothetical protein PVI23_07080 [Maricaulaceae bacterium]|jgi:hypothetical protein